MDDSRITVNRLMVGVCALLCLGGAVVLWILFPNSSREDETQQWDMLKAACTRIGLVMGALWLALPSGNRQVEIAPKTLLAGLAAFIGIVLRPKVIVPLIAVLAVLAFLLRPRDKNRTSEKLARWYRVKPRDDQQ